MPRQMARIMSSGQRRSGLSVRWTHDIELNAMCVEFRGDCGEIERATSSGHHAHCNRPLPITGNVIFADPGAIRNNG